MIRYPLWTFGRSGNREAIEMIVRGRVADPAQLVGKALPFRSIRLMSIGAPVDDSLALVSQLKSFGPISGVGRASQRRPVSAEHA
jgi:hypothetical protein